MTGVLQISDLENLIGLYREWHSHILPYYSFEHFVHKVEQVAATKRVKVKMIFFLFFYNERIAEVYIYGFKVHKFSLIAYCDTSIDRI